MSTISIDYASRECKASDHESCSSIWQGLNLKVHCTCVCHMKRNEALE